MPPGCMLHLLILISVHTRTRARTRTAVSTVVGTQRDRMLFMMLANYSITFFLFVYKCLQNRGMYYPWYYLVKRMYYGCTVYLHRSPL